VYSFFILNFDRIKVIHSAMAFQSFTFDIIIVCKFVQRMDPKHFISCVSCKVDSKSDHLRDYKCIHYLFLQNHFSKAEEDGHF
jgi:hypothetical protein